MARQPWPMLTSGPCFGALARGGAKTDPAGDDSFHAHCETPWPNTARERPGLEVLVAYVATKPHRPLVAKYAILGLCFYSGTPEFRGIFFMFYVSMIRGGSPAFKMASNAFLSRENEGG